MLAVSAKPSADFTVWTIALRHGVQFHDGTNFDAAVVVANYNAAAANATVGLAIQPIIASVTEVNSFTVEYKLVLPFANFPVMLSEQQIAYMAAPSALGNNLRRQADRHRSLQVQVLECGRRVPVREEREVLAQGRRRVVDCPTSMASTSRPSWTRPRATKPSSQAPWT